MTDIAKKTDPVGALTKFLEKLVPPKNVVVRDVLGGEHRLAAVVSARQQIVVAREVQAILAEPALARFVNGVATLGDLTDPGDVLVRFVGMAATPEVIEHLAAAFAAAHPAAVAAAKKAAHANPDLPDDPDAADLFPVEELAAGLAPLFVGLLRRMTQGLQVAAVAVE